MYDRILVPTDGSEAADRALDLAAAVAASHDAELHVLYVADTNQPSLSRIRGQVVDILEREGDRIVDEAAERVRGSGVDVTTAVVQGGPSRTILDYVDERGVDLVAMGTRGERDVEQLLLGSVTERVVRSAAVPVLGVPPDSDRSYPPGRVLVGSDGSDGSEAALAEGIGIAERSDAALHVVTVLEQSLLGIDVRSAAAAEERECRAEELLETARSRAGDAGVASVETSVEEGDVAATLTDHAESHDVDLVVVGTHGRSGIDRRLLGSVTEDLLRTATVPVLSVRATDGE
ncbi:MAG: universal stress protein [Haloarculaceae archaeon]